MKTTKRILIGLLVLVVLLLIAIITVPILFKDQIVTSVKNKLNEELDATVEFQDVHLSLLRSFPQLSVQLDEFSIVGKEQFQDIHLMDLEQLQLGMDLMSVLKKSRQPEIKKIHLAKPDLNIVVLENGDANYNIYTPKEAKQTKTPNENSKEVLSLNIQRLSLDEARLRYDDRSSGTLLDIEGMDANTSARIRGNELNTSNTISIGQFTVKSGEVAYLDEAEIDLKTDLLVDLDKMRFVIGDNSSSINDLELKAEGSLQMGEGYQDYDINFKCPSDDFAQFLSLMPGAYTKDFDKVKTSGKLGLEGSVTGRYSESSMPDIDIKLAIDQGAFKYPGYEQEIRDIFADVSVAMRQNLKDVQVRSPQFDFSLDGQKMHTAFTLEDALQDPHVVAEADGQLDLAKLSEAYPFPGIKSMKGLVDLDVQADVRQSEVTKKNYAKLKAKGYANTDALEIQYGDYPNIVLTDLKTDLSPEAISFDVGQIKTPNSVGNMSIAAEDYLPYALADGKVDIDIKGDFATLDANEFMPQPSSTKKTTKDEELPIDSDASSATPEVDVASSFQRLRAHWDLKCQELVYGDQTIKDIKSKGLMANDGVELQQFAMIMDDSHMKASGKLSEITGYLYEGKTLKGKLDFDADYINVNDWMQQTPESDQKNKTNENSEAPPAANAQIPKNIDVQLNSKIDRLIYGNYDLNNTKGIIDVRDQAVILEDVTTQALGGKMGLQGRYETPDDEAHNFSIKYKMQEVQFQELFTQINTFKALIPVGQFIEGLLNTELILEGDMNDGYMPAWETLNGQGFLQTLNGVFKETGVIKKIADKFQINEIKDIALENTKNWLTIKNGQVEVKKFDFEVEGIKCTMGGAHSITQSMDYTIVARIPKEMMDNNVVGQSLNNGIDFITKEAQKKGINLQNGDFYMVEIDLTGNIKSPQSSFKLLGTEEKDLSNLIQETTDEVKEKIRDTVQKEIDTLIEKSRKEAEEKVDEIKDTVKAEVKKQVDTLKNKAGEEAKKIIEDNLNEEGKDALNDIKNSIFKDGEGSNEIEDALDDWNPFKKKKKKKKNNE